MLVNRRTFNVKNGRTDEAVTLLKEAIAQFTTYTRTSRIYTPETGSFDVVAVEWEYENLEEYERRWAEWGATPEAATFLERWYAVTERGGANEIWHLAAQS